MYKVPTTILPLMFDVRTRRVIHVLLILLNEIIIAIEYMCGNNCIYICIIICLDLPLIEGKMLLMVQSILEMCL